MASVQLPILTLAVREQRYSCHGCGNCCRDFTVQLRPEDLEKLADQGWESKLNQAVTIEFRGVTYLRQREDGTCIFLMDNGLCRIHAEYGFEAKPIACQLFPFHLTPVLRSSGRTSGRASGGGGVAMGINFACQSVLENKGAELRSHAADLGRMAGELDELRTPAAPPLLTDRLRASASEEQSLIKHIDNWLKRHDLCLPLRLDGLAWIAQSLARAKLQNVREDRFAELLDVLFGALPAELEHHPIDPPTARQRRLLRQAVFSRTEDPKINLIERQGRWRTMFSQLVRSRRFKRGRGIAPAIGQGWPTHVRLEAVEQVRACSETQNNSSEMVALLSHPIDELMTRYLRAAILGGRAWGPGYYGWPMVAGLQAMLLNVAAVGWLARLHAAGRGRDSIDIIDVRAALGRIDRTAGRAKWLGSAAERLRLAYFSMDDGLRRLIAAYAPVEQ